MANCMCAVTRHGAGFHQTDLTLFVRRVGNETKPRIHGFCSFYPFGAIRGVPLLRLTAFIFHTPARFGFYAGNTSYFGSI